MTRQYSDEEDAAFRTVGLGATRSGVAQYAGGHYWPDKLEADADAAERLIPYQRLAAAALRREIAADPLTSASGGVPQEQAPTEHVNGCIPLRNGGCGSYSPLGKGCPCWCHIAVADRGRWSAPTEDSRR